MTDPNTDRPITTLELPSNIEWALDRAGIQTLAQLTAKTPAELLELPRIGRRSIELIEGVLKNRGLGLRIEETTPPQDGAPDSKCQVDSAPQCLPQLRSRFYDNLEVFALAVHPSGLLPDIQVWQVKEDQLEYVTRDVRNPHYPEFIEDYIDRHGLFLDVDSVEIAVRLRSFFGLVDRLVTIMSIKIEHRDSTSLHKTVERTIGLTQDNP